MLSKVVGDGGVYWDLCLTGVVALGGALRPGAELRGSLGIAQGKCSMPGSGKRESKQ